MIASAESLSEVELDCEIFLDERERKEGDKLCLDSDAGYDDLRG